MKFLFIRLLQYNFKNSRLIEAVALVPITYSSTLMDYLLERYNAVAIDDIVGGSTDDFIFANGTDKHKPDTTVVASLEGLDYWMVMYMLFPQTRSASDTDEMKILKQEMLKQLGME